MELNTLKPAPGSKRARKRVCRGIGSGTGKTGGRGHKGQRARSGGFHKVGFEGGQMPLQRRLPKRGFNSPSGKLTRKVALAGIAVSKGARAAIEAAGGSTDAPVPQPKPKPEPKWVAAPQPEAQAKPGKDEAKAKADKSEAKAKADKSEAKAKGEAKKAEARPDAKSEGKKGKKGE